MDIYTQIFIALFVVQALFNFYLLLRPDRSVKIRDDLRLFLKSAESEELKRAKEFEQLKGETLRYPEKANSLEVQFAELHEQVTTSLKKINSRQWRAEKKEEEALLREQINSMQYEEEPDQQELFSNGTKPRLTRRGSK